jgi:hypothetical protein
MSCTALAFPSPPDARQVRNGLREPRCDEAPKFGETAPAREPPKADAAKAG